MDMRNFEQCRLMTKSPSWTVIDVVRWKVVPEQLGGGRRYARGFKNAWVKKHSSHIRLESLRYKLPPELLAGVCWIEVGGDPNIIDRFAFEARAFDWSGPDYIDRNFTVLAPPEKTSFGFVSMQLRTAAQTMGLNANQMSISELRALSQCLEKDTYNIKLTAMHLRQLADYDKLPVKLGMNDVKIIGSRYNRGTNPSMESLKKDMSYGEFIVKNWEHFHRLVW
ncbi:hypothetical protein ERHA54_35530 [Erwinia rhapontici]|uniref:Uncharacterized protein n=1 Tax=Erwinia rhapontici TaxID=55212 RepID=A0ABM7N3F3_ERWRD|nr:hypothetical protein [Erwinia rhapontici]BCQ35972.1 hypothetical protein ERHA53_33150 [Erwinia rhapontici]BCQ40950.1 hypothetical protein ERHA54_35530 [Erwinia rhapontici]BCQ46200.1 hypothetical protein ERHA55_37270 [Erwinia rhapontici]